MSTLSATVLYVEYVDLFFVSHSTVLIHIELNVFSPNLKEYICPKLL